VRSGRVDKVQERSDEAAAVAEELRLTKEAVVVLYKSAAALLWRSR
jgi:hypothetical protein